MDTSTVRTLGIALAIAAGLAALAPLGVAEARKAEIYSGLFSTLAAGGYDPVAYFTQGRPVEGRRDITLQWKGATWRFSSEQNRDLFKAKPEAYAPQYGGHCAWAVSQGYTAKGDPRHWRIVGGKLYLNYDAAVHRTWEVDAAAHISKGDGNWPTVLDR